MREKTRTILGWTLVGFLCFALAAGAQTEVERRVPASATGW